MMKATVQTRIFLALTIDEARAAVTRPTDMQLAIRSTLFEIDGMPISEMFAAKPALIAAPKDGHKKAKKRTHRIHAPDKECPYCHETKHPTGYGRHIIACRVKHPDAMVGG
jgi:hypothetical protein